MAAEFQGWASEVMKDPAALIPVALIAAGVWAFAQTGVGRRLVGVVAAQPAVADFVPKCKGLIKLQALDAGQELLAHARLSLEAAG